MPGGTSPVVASSTVGWARIGAPAEVPGPLARAVAPGGRERAVRSRSAGGACRLSAAPGWPRHAAGAELGVAPADVPLSDGPRTPDVPRGPHLNVPRAGEVVGVDSTRRWACRVWPARGYVGAAEARGRRPRLRTAAPAAAPGAGVPA